MKTAIKDRSYQIIPTTLVTIAMRAFTSNTGAKAEKRVPIFIQYT